MPSPNPNRGKRKRKSKPKPSTEESPARAPAAAPPPSSNSTSVLAKNKIKKKKTEKVPETEKNEDGSLWNPGSVLPAGLMTFYRTTKPLEKSWHVMGLGYNPSVSQDEIRNAAVIHFNGNMKPWLDVALNQYKHLWSKYFELAFTKPLFCCHIKLLDFLVRTGNHEGT